MHHDDGYFLNLFIFLIPNSIMGLLLLSVGVPKLSSYVILSPCMKERSTYSENSSIPESHGKGKIFKSVLFI